MTAIRFLLLCCVVLSPAAVGAQHVCSLKGNHHEHVVFTYDGVAPYREGGKWGFVDSLDRVIVEAQYDSLWPEDKLIAIGARGEHGVVYYDQALKQLFSGPVTDLSALDEYKDSSPEGERISYLEDLAERNDVAILFYGQSWREKAENYGLAGGIIADIFTRSTKDSTFLTVHYADGRNLAFAEAKENNLFVLPPGYVCSRIPNGRKLTDLRTGKTFTDNGVIRYFQHAGKEYRIVPQGTYIYIDEHDEARSWKREEKYASYLLTDAAGKELRRYSGMIFYSHGMIFEKVYVPETNSYKGLRATAVDDLQPVYDSVFLSFETWNDFLTLTCADGSFLYFHPSGKQLYAGRIGDRIYPLFTEQDTLLECNGVLMTLDGKELIRLEPGSPIMKERSHYILLHYGHWETETVRHAVYHADDKSLTVLDYPELHVLKDSFLLLVKDSLDYKAIDDYGNVLSSLPVNAVEWISAGKTGIIVGGVPETNKKMLRKRQVFIDTMKHRIYLSEFGMQPWKRLYFDQSLRPLSFPEEYMFSPTGIEGLVYYSAPSKPEFIGVMKTDGTIVIPNDYRCINDLDGKCFAVYDANERLGYIRPDGRKLF